MIFKAGTSQADMARARQLFGKMPLAAPVVPRPSYFRALNPRPQLAPTDGAQRAGWAAALRAILLGRKP